MARHLIGYFEECGRPPPIGDDHKPTVIAFLSVRGNLAVFVVDQLLEIRCKVFIHNASIGRLP